MFVHKLKMFFSHESIVSLLIYFNSHFWQKLNNVLNCSFVLLIYYFIKQWYALASSDVFFFGMFDR